MTSCPTRPPADAARRDDRRVLARFAAALVLAAAPVLALAACGDGSPTAAARSGDRGAADGHAGHAGGHGDEGDRDTDPTTVEVTLDDHSFTPGDAVAAPGPVTVRVTNQGEEAHQLTLGKPAKGLTAANFAERWARDGEVAVLEQVEWVGGPNAVAPGDTGEAVSELEAGDYLMVCFMPTDDGTSHVVEQMVGTLHVTGAPTGPRTTPQPTATIGVEDFSIAIPEGFDGQGLVELANTGGQAHEVILLRAHEGKDVEDIFAWEAGGRQGAAPFTFAGGIGEVEPGARAYAELDLEPGRYLAVCFVPDVAGDGTPHVALGMVEAFTIDAT